ncbi:ABC transporter ATP-binding protein [Paenibacillus paeoniae]|uniref:ABC transporter ATP-binding protein n=1 Tax=Paenibacillus paeoniae TaxID=2292705 RepID=A0A371PEZ1_9BACL|nr:ABC transporter ATP-binding protein [Paenibacillus paeoniae]REK74479.1 ABC transporter ATP-binding protein [Paenibacillus paeoniae]
MGYIIETTSLSKQYGHETVVNQVNLKVQPGTIYGLLGENGAGKTTLMKMLTTLALPTQGAIKLFGTTLERNSDLMSEVGAMIETPVFYSSLSAEENLMIHCRYKKVPLSDMKEYLEMLGIYKHRDKKVKQFSLGMKQRLGLARSLIGNPRLLILDEPINGLDPSGIKEIRELLIRLKKERGTTILLSSHILNEIEHCADTIGFMHKGVLCKEKGIGELQDAEIRLYEIKIKHLDLHVEKLKKVFEVVNIYHQTVVVSAAGLTATEAIKRLIENEIEMIEMKALTESLEDYYMTMIAERKEGEAI